MEYNLSVMLSETFLLRIVEGDLAGLSRKSVWGKLKRFDHYRGMTNCYCLCRGIKIIFFPELLITKSDIRVVI